jgi:hypothetical protein
VLAGWISFSAATSVNDGELSVLQFPHGPANLTCLLSPAREDGLQPASRN